MTPILHWTSWVGPAVGRIYFEGEGRYTAHYYEPAKDKLTVLGTFTTAATAQDFIFGFARLKGCPDMTRPMPQPSAVEYKRGREAGKEDYLALARRPLDGKSEDFLEGYWDQISALQGT